MTPKIIFLLLFLTAVIIYFIAFEGKAKEKGNLHLFPREELICKRIYSFNRTIRNFYECEDLLRNNSKILFLISGFEERELKIDAFGKEGICAGHFGDFFFDVFRNGSVYICKRVTLTRELPRMEDYDCKEVFSFERNVTSYVDCVSLFKENIEEIKERSNITGDIIEIDPIGIFKGVICSPIVYTEYYLKKRIPLCHKTDGNIVCEEGKEDCVFDCLRNNTFEYCLEFCNAYREVESIEKRSYYFGIIGKKVYLCKIQ